MPIRGARAGGLVDGRRFVAFAARGSIVARIVAPRVAPPPGGAIDIALAPDATRGVAAPRGGTGAGCQPRRSRRDFALAQHDPSGTHLRHRIPPAKDFPWPRTRSPPRRRPFAGAPSPPI